MKVKSTQFLNLRNDTKKNFETKRSTPRYRIDKLLKAKNKEEIFKAARET